MSSIEDIQNNKYFFFQDSASTDEHQERKAQHESRDVSEMRLEDGGLKI